MNSPNKALINSFKKRLQEIEEENIINLSKNNSAIFNVVRGLHKEAFTTILWDDTKPNFDYYLIFIIRHNEKLEGFICRLQPHLKTRNELTNVYALFICQRYNQSDAIKVYNTYQDQQRSMFEQLDYWTFDDSLKEMAKGKKSSIILKNSKGLLYVPFAKPIDNVTDKNEQKTHSKKVIKKVNFVYLMINQRNGYYKIGRSINPEYREKTLQSEEPEVDLLYKWPASKAVEKTLHNKFKSKKVRGEWFELNENDIIEITSFMELIIEAKTKSTKRGK
jgi:tetrahydromethanopterin S-methyltransferase subunit G